MVEINCLGGFEVRLEKRPLTHFYSQKSKALLAYLAVEAGRSLDRSHLAGLLWPDYTEKRARHNLSQTLLALRKDLGGAEITAVFLHATNRTLHFEAGETVFVDVVAFEAQQTAVRQHSHANPLTCPNCTQRLQQAADLYSGPFLDQFVLGDSDLFENWLTSRRETLLQQAVDVFTRLSDSYAAQTRLEEALQVGQRLLEIVPWQESAHRQRMSLLAQQGQRTQALAQYDLLCDVLLAEFGVAPEEETTALWQSLKTGAMRSKPAPPDPTPVTSLPSSPTPFIGREQELALLNQRLAEGDYRLISLVGPGGMGKSRLALEAARQNGRFFADGVCFVPLAAVQQPDEVPFAIATELGLLFNATSQSPRQQLLAALRPKQMLLLLDNLEHLLVGETASPEPAEEAVSTLINLLIDLLRQAPALVLLTTSREQLNLQAEDLHTLHGLPIPDTSELTTAKQFAAIRLFCDRAYRLQKSFKLTDENLADVVRICELVEGMPLGIELAATWIRDLDCAGIAQALENSAGLLQTTALDVVPQHRSVHAAFDHSWRLLTAQEQAVLCRLAVFPGSFAAAAAAEVAGATSLLLTRLGHKSLIRGVGNGRYDLHSLLRRFSLEKLQENSLQAHAAQQRHSDYYLHFVAQHSAALHGEAPQLALTEIRQELDNVRQAWQWSVDNGHFDSLIEGNCVAGLIRFYLATGLRAEGESTFAYALHRLEQRADNSHVARQLRQNLLAALTEMLIPQSKFKQALAHAEAVIALAVSRQDVAGQAWGQHLLGAAYAKKGELDTAYRHLKEALALVRQSGQRARESEILRFLGTTARDLGDRVQAAHYLDQALQLNRSMGNRSREQADLLFLGAVAMERYDYVAALSYIQEALQLIKVTGDRGMESRIENLTGCGFAALGRYETALDHHHNSRRIALQIGDPFQESHALHNLCTVSRKLGRLETAVSYGREALRLGLENNLLDPEACAWLHLGYALLDAGQLAEAADAFARARAGWLALNDADLAMEATVGEAGAALQQGKRAEALAKANTVLAYMDEYRLEGADEPFQIYLNLYHVLQANNDSRAPALLAKARQLIEERASLLPDEKTRQTFLFNVPSHRVIMGLSTKMV